jgi:hypothetical protein
MISIFNPNDQRVLALISCISGLCGREVDQVTSAWKRADAHDRARAWAQINRAATGRERYRILSVAALARREALETAHRMHRTDWAFWAAACDAGAAVAAEARIGRHFDTLIAPFAEVIPALACPAPDSAAVSAAATRPGRIFPSRAPSGQPNRAAV